MNNEQIRESLLAVTLAVAQMANQEMARMTATLPPGAEPAIGDGSFLANLFKLLEMLMPLIKMFFPTLPL